MPQPEIPAAANPILMKKQVLLLLGGFGLLVANAQSPLIMNGSFEYTCGTNNTVTGDGCHSFDASCVPFWQPSHGTPEIVFSGSADQNNHVRMWCGMKYGTHYGEGIYTQLLQPTDNRERYALCFWYKTTNQTGNFYFKLCNSITTHTSYCGEVAGSTGPYETIYTGTFGNTNWTFVSIPFVPGDTYNYLMIYPSSTESVDNPPVLYVDGISIYSCAGSLDIDLSYPFLPVSGLYERTGYIRAGSNILSPGHGTPVSINANVNTAFYSGTFVELDDNFISLPADNHFFVAAIQDNCLCTESFDDQRFAASAPEDDYGDEEGQSLLQTAHFSPNAPIIVPYIDGQYQVTHTTTLLDITLFDMTGRTLRREHPNREETILDLTAFADGIYLVQIRDKNGSVFSEKINR